MTNGGGGASRSWSAHIGASLPARTPCPFIGEKLAPCWRRDPEAIGVPEHCLRDPAQRAGPYFDLANHRWPWRYLQCFGYERGNSFGQALGHGSDGYGPQKVRRQPDTLPISVFEICHGKYKKAPRQRGSAGQDWRTRCRGASGNQHDPCRVVPLIKKMPRRNFFSPLRFFAYGGYIHNARLCRDLSHRRDRWRFGWAVWRGSFRSSIARR